LAVSKRLRYEVLRRDNYTCRYCGAKAPDVKITVDHVVPVALGGTDEPSNLVAACDACNDGKTSASPDAPLVADVAADALRWSQAMTAAAGEMLAKASGDVDARTHFEHTWSRYGSGPKREPLPKDPGWQNTVDNLLRAGLPMAVLEQCVEIAMGQRRVSAENVFRYMCGVAWRKVRELRERAGETVQGGPADDHDGDEPEDVESEAVSNWCRVILKQHDPREVERAARRCLEQAGDEEPQGVLWFVIHGLDMDRTGLCSALRELLEALPGDLGIKEIREQEEYWQDRLGSSDERSVLSWAASNVTGQLKLDRARRELAAMPADARDGWMQRARDEWAEIAGHVDESFYVCEAADLARRAAAGVLT
jgi:HNH endonuclease